MHIAQQYDQTIFEGGFSPFSLKAFSQKQNNYWIKIIHGWLLVAPLQSLHFLLMDQQEQKLTKDSYGEMFFNIYFFETAETSLYGHLENVHIFVFDPKSKMALKMFIYFFSCWLEI